MSLGKLEVRLLGCEDLLKPLGDSEQEDDPNPAETPAAHKPDGPPGKQTFCIFKMFPWTRVISS